MIYVNFISSMITGVICVISLLIIVHRSRTTKNCICIRIHNNISWTGFSWLSILILLVLISIRLYEFGNVPSWYNIDEAMSAYDANSISLYGTDHLGNRLPVHMQAWGFTNQSSFLAYLISISIRIFGYNIYAVRLPLFVLSIIGAIFCALLVKELIDASAGNLTLLICCFNPWHLVQSRYSIDCNVFPHILMIGMFLFVLAIKHYKASCLYFGVATLAISMYSYVVAIYSVPIFLLILAIYLLKKNYIKIKHLMISIAIFMFISSPILLTFILNALGLNHSIVTPLFTIPTLSATTRKGDLLFYSDNVFNQLINNILSVFKVAFLQPDCGPWDTVEHYGTMFHCMAVFSVLGIIYFFLLFRKKRNRIKNAFSDGWFVLIDWGIMSLIVGVLTDDITVIRRFNVFYYLQIIFIVMGFIAIYQYSIKALAGIVLLYCFIGVLLLYSYFNSYAGQFRGNDSITACFPEALKKAKEYKCDHYYISSAGTGKDTPYISEIYTLTVFNIDSQYYLDKTTCSYDIDYGKYYDEQFQYVDFDSSENYQDDKSVYVVNTGTDSIFSDEEYTKYYFGIYTTIVPKNLDLVHS